jgi:hypothetical protein
MDAIFVQLTDNLCPVSGSPGVLSPGAGPRLTKYLEVLLAQQLVARNRPAL